MPHKKKNLCKMCQVRHSPPTGKKCRNIVQEQSDSESEPLRDAAVKGSTSTISPNRDSGQWIQDASCCKQWSQEEAQECKVKYR